MEEQDYLLRQIRQLVEVLAVSRGTAVTLHEDLDRRVQSAVGMSLDTAERLPLGALLGLLRTDEGLDAARALILGLALEQRAEHAERETLLHRSAGLISAALEAEPALTELLPDRG